MKTFKAGEFEITVRDPAPQWLDIVYHGVSLIYALHPDELPDLQYVINRAMVELAQTNPATFRGNITSVDSK